MRTFTVWPIVITVSVFHCIRASKTNKKLILFKVELNIKKIWLKYIRERIVGKPNLQNHASDKLERK
jgi:hypothetical protein